MFDGSSVLGATAEPSPYTTPVPTGSRVSVQPELQMPRYSILPAQMTIAQRTAFLPGERTPPSGGVPIVVPGQRVPAPPPMERPTGPGGAPVITGDVPNIDAALQQGVQETGKSIRTIVLVVGALGLAGLALYFFTRSSGKAAKANPRSGGSYYALIYKPSSGTPKAYEGPFLTRSKAHAEGKKAARRMGYRRVEVVTEATWDKKWH